MKIAASDYDGTLFRNDTITAADAQSVQRWREAGHKFGVVTGRDYGMLAPQLEHYGIGYDYAVCNNGAIICQSEGTPLWEGRIEPRILKAISEIPEVRRSFHFAFSAATQTYLCHEFEGSWIAREGRQWDFPVIDIEEKDILSLPQVHQFSLGYETPEESLAASQVVNTYTRSRTAAASISPRTASARAKASSTSWSSCIGTPRRPRSTASATRSMICR